MDPEAFKRIYRSQKRPLVNIIPATSPVMSADEYRTFQLLIYRNSKRPLVQRWAALSIPN